MMRGSRRMYVVETGEGVRMTVPTEWTDRGSAPEDARVSQETLIELRALIDALEPGMPGAQGRERDASMMRKGGKRGRGQGAGPFPLGTEHHGRGVGPRPSRGRGGEHDRDVAAGEGRRS
jgi:hypothetical protein